MSRSVVHHFRAYRICFVSCRAEAAGLCASTRAVWKDQGGRARSALSKQCDRGQVPRSDVYVLREGGVLWCESGIPSETAAESAVHGA